jgi:putative ABC transport system permease protein
MNMPQTITEGQPILDNEAVVRIRQYIERKHPDFTHDERESLFANAVHRIMDRHLPDFAEETKVRLRQQLLERIGLEQRFTLLTEHILEACLQLELEEDGAQQLELWMKKCGLERDERIAEESQENVLQGELETAAAVAASMASPYVGSRSAVWRWGGLTAMALALGTAGLLYINGSSRPAPDIVKNAAPAVEAASPPSSAGALPPEYGYQDLDTGKLQEWLNAKKSLLAEEPYFSAILTAAKTNGIHPLLLFAITGQEQGYVPKDGKKSRQIANNPFNVYHSWTDYNTNIADSARIASRTILNISSTRPEEAHPIEWLNTRYAEDPNWWIGVNAIFEKMRREIPQSSKVEEHPNNADGREQAQQEHLE